MSTKTGTPADDELVNLLEAVLRSDEGQALFDYLVKLTTNLAFTEMDE
jgi:hypothetical protein